ALAKLIDIFGRFWESDRLVARRLRGLAAIDPEFEQVVRSRDERRRKGLTVMLQRLSAQNLLKAPEPLNELVQVAFVLTGFDTFDMLAGPGRSCAEMVPTVQRLVRAALGL